MTQTPVPSQDDPAVGLWGRPGITAIGQFVVSAIRNDWGFDTPVIEVKIRIGDVDYDNEGAVRIFDSRQEFEDFLVGLRAGRWPVPLGPEHNIYSQMLCEAGDDTWASREKREQIAEFLQLKLPENHESRTTWDKL